MSFESNAGSVYYAVSCGIPSIGGTKAYGYDSEFGVLYTEAKTAGLDGNNLFVSMSTIHLSSSTVTTAFTNGNGVYVSIPYKKYMYVTHTDVNNPANNFNVYMGGYFVNYPRYGFASPYLELVLEFFNGRWIIRDEASSEEINYIPEENESGVPIIPYYPDGITGWNNSSSYTLSGDITIDGYHDSFDNIANVINNLGTSPLSVYNETPGDYMPSYLTTNYIDLEGATGVDLTSNSNNVYHYNEPNDYILWGQNDTFTHPQTNIGSNPYYLECDRPSDVGLDLESNKETQYFYSSAFNCVSFCD